MGIEAVPKTDDLIAKHQLEGEQAEMLLEAVLLHYRLMPPPGLPIDRNDEQRTQSSLNELIKQMSPATLSAFEEFLNSLLIALKPSA